MTAENRRLAEAQEHATPWKKWGPYLKNPESRPMTRAKVASPPLGSLTSSCAESENPPHRKEESK